MRITMVTGSYPPRVCGVGDYVANLVDNLRKENQTVTVITGNNWRTNTYKSWSKQLPSSNPDIIHFQYPTLAYGRSLIPQLLALLHRNKIKICTIHEFQRVCFLRKLATIPFFFLCQHLIVTNKFEKEFICRFFPFVYKKISVIPIGHNIAPQSQTMKRDSNGVVFFGIIMPGKGLEQFINLVRQSKQLKLAFRFTVVSMVHPDYHEYLNQIRISNADLAINWKIGLNLTEAGKILQANAYAYLPFPDGATEKRSSLLTTMALGLIAICPKGKATTKELASCIKLTDHNNPPLQILQNISTDEEQKNKLLSNAKLFLQKRKWGAIANMHITEYTKLTKNH